MNCSKRDAKSGFPTPLINLARRKVVGAALLLSMTACATKPPKPVENLTANQHGNVTVVSWSNPQDFSKVEIAGPEGKSKPGPSSQGQVEVVFVDVAPGDWQISVSSWASTEPSSKRDKSTLFTVKPMPIPYFDIRNSELKKQDLAVAFIVHPGIQGDLREVLRQVSIDALSAVFRSAIELPDLTALDQIEALSGPWPGTDLCIIVDEKQDDVLASGLMPGIGIRIMDVGHAKRLQKAYTGLYNNHALITEAYVEVQSCGHRDVQDGWMRLLREAMGNERYIAYRECCSTSERKENSYDGLSQQDVVTMMLTGEIHGSLKVDPKQSSTNNLKRIEATTRLLLFGPRAGQR